MRKRRRKPMKKLRIQNLRTMRMLMTKSLMMKTQMTKKMPMNHTTNCNSKDSQKRLGFNLTMDTVNLQSYRIEANSFYETIRKFLSDDAFNLCASTTCVCVSES